MADRLNIARAIKRPGQLHRDLNIPQNERIPDSLLQAAARRNDKVGQRARFAIELKGFRK